MSAIARSFAMAGRLAGEKHLILICGHYEGVDARVTKAIVTDEISIGDYVVTGGEIPAMVIIDAVTRLLPGVLGNAKSAQSESFTQGLLEYPQYTRPAEFRGCKVPDVLMSGDHKKIEQWRHVASFSRTATKRPDLLRIADLSDEDRKFLLNCKHKE